MALTREKQPTEANLTPRIMRNVGTYLTQARLEARDGSFDSNLFLGVLLQYVAALTSSLSFEDLPLFHFSQLYQKARRTTVHVCHHQKPDHTKEVSSVLQMCAS